MPPKTTATELHSTHTRAIEIQITNQFLHSLANGTSADEPNTLVAADILQQRLDGIAKVLGIEDGSGVTGEDFFNNKAALEGDGIGFSDSFDLLDRAKKLLQHANPQNLSKEDAEEKEAEQMESLGAAQRGEVGDSLSFTSIRVDRNTYTLETKGDADTEAGGVKLKDQPFGILGLSINDCQKGGVEYHITAKHIRDAVRGALTKVQTSLTLKLQLRKKLDDPGLDQDLRNVYRAIIASENTADPAVFTRDSLQSIAQIIERRKDDKSFLDKLKASVPQLKALIESNQPITPSAATPAPIAAKTAEEKFEALNLIQAISLSLGDTSTPQHWDELRERLLKNEEEFIFFTQEYAKKTICVVAEEALSALTIRELTKNDSAAFEDALGDAKELEPAELITAALLREGRVDELKQLLQSSKGKNSLQIGDGNDAKLLLKIAAHCRTAADHDHDGLLSKIDNPALFQNDEFTDRDAKSYSQYVFSQKYPNSGAFADYASVGIARSEREAATLVNRMAKTIQNGKWGLFHYSTGGHWRLVAISPDKEVICLDSIGTGKLGNLPDAIAKDIEAAFKKANHVQNKPTHYYGLGTQRGVQCGLHSCLAMEEIVKTIIESKPELSPKDLWQMEAMQFIASFDVPVSRELSARDSIIFAKIVDHFDKTLTGDNKDLLRRVCAKKSFSPEDVTAFSALKKNILVEYQEKMRSFHERSRINVQSIIDKALEPSDPLRKKPSDVEIVSARVEVAVVQLDELHVDSLTQYPWGGVQAISDKINARNALSDFPGEGLRPTPLSTSAIRPSPAPTPIETMSLETQALIKSVAKRMTNPSSTTSTATTVKTANDAAIEAAINESLASQRSEIVPEKAYRGIGVVAEVKKLEGDIVVLEIGSIFDESLARFFAGASATKMNPAELREKLAGKFITEVGGTSISDLANHNGKDTPAFLKAVVGMFRGEGNLEFTVTDKLGGTTTKIKCERNIFVAQTCPEAKTALGDKKGAQYNPDIHGIVALAESDKITAAAKRVMSAAKVPSK